MQQIKTFDEMNNLILQILVHDSLSCILSDFRFISLRFDNVLDKTRLALQKISNTVRVNHMFSPLRTIMQLTTEKCTSKCTFSVNPCFYIANIYQSRPTRYCFQGILYVPIAHKLHHSLDLKKDNFVIQFLLNCMSFIISLV